MCAPHRTGPAFWNHLTRTLLRPGDTLSTRQTAEAIREFCLQSGEEELKFDTYQQAATAFLGTYSNPDGLGGLGILKRDDRPGTYIVSEPVLPEPQVVAYVVADYWDGVWPDLVSIDFNKVVGPEGPAALLLLSSSDMFDMLRAMQADHFVLLERATHPWKVKRLWSDANELLERVYTG